jgi:hypothetical protein
LVKIDRMTLPPVAVKAIKAAVAAALVVVVNEGLGGEVAVHD